MGEVLNLNKARKARARADKATTAFMLNIQEALVRRDENLKMEPSLAVSWSNPSPTVFGFHEVFHSLVVAAAVAHFVLVMRLLSRTG